MGKPGPLRLFQGFPNELNHTLTRKFIGRVVGKAIYDEQLLDAHFTSSFYKHMLSQVHHV